MALGPQSFATFLILCPTSFFLGIVFSLFPYDYPILWTTPSSLPTTAFNIYSTHVSLLYNSPPLIQRILHIVVFVGLLGFLLKLYKPSESNMLFDGAGLVLYMCGITVYLTNIVAGMRAVSEGEDGVSAEQDRERQDGLKVMAASNTILALVLLGVLVLQAGQWYAERKQGQEEEAMRKGEASKGKNGVARASSSKKKV